MIEPKIPKFKKYRSAKSLMKGCFPDAVSFGGKDFEIPLDEFIKTLESQGLWGVTENKGIIHYWMDPLKMSPSILGSFFVHELTHVNMVKFKRIKDEENFARLADRIADIAFSMALKLLKKIPKV